MIHFKGLIHGLAAVKLKPCGLRQEVWEMIPHQDDNGIIQLSCVLQPIQEIFHSQFQLVLTTEISKHCIVLIFILCQFLYSIYIFPVHAVVGIIGAVSAKGHIVCMEPVIIYEIIHRLFKHLQIRCRPGGGEGHAVTHKFDIFISKVWP